MNSKSDVGESKLISDKSDVPVYILFLLSTNAQDVLVYKLLLSTNAQDVLAYIDSFSNGKVVPVEDSVDLLISDS